MAASAETFIDKIADLFKISDGETGTIRSFHVFDRNEMPAAMAADMAPCVIHYITNCQPEYSEGGPTIFFWDGQSEWHLTKDVKPSNVRIILPFYGRILAKAMSDMQLSGTVNSFVIPPEEGAMSFVTFRNVEGRDDHQGIVVKWKVKQDVTGQYTVSR